MGKKWMTALALMAVMGLAACLASCSQNDAVKAATIIYSCLPAGGDGVGERRYGGRESY